MNSTDKIKHLYWRAGFGLSPEEWEMKKDWSINKAVDNLFQAAAKAPPLQGDNKYLKNAAIKKGMLSKMEQKKIRKDGNQLVYQLIQECMERMADKRQSELLERMTLFWHGHFACVSKEPAKAFSQLKVIRQHALGNFREFVHAICKDVSMIRFLNNQQNRKRKPNENFARELMELFTIGRGNYSEQDIKEAARSFTGWSSNKGVFVFKERNHDYDSKTFMGKTGNFNGNDIVDIILDRPETALFITTKIYRYFVNEKVDARQVEKLSNEFYKSDYDIKKLMRSIFKSDWFYDKKNVGTKIKSPIELLAGIMRTLKVKFKNGKSISFAQKALGQKMFIPPNVAGWPGGKTWIDNSTLVLRLNLVLYLYGKTEVNFKVKDELEAKKRGEAFRRIEGSIDFEPLVKTFDKMDQKELFESMKSYILPVPIKLKPTAFEPFVYNNSKEEYIRSLAMRLMSLPEYQLC